jgi:hypothetical protein
MQNLAALKLYRRFIVLNLRYFVKTKVFPGGWGIIATEENES